jgi:hypothetical protein
MRPPEVYATMLYVFRLERSNGRDQLPEAGRAFLWRDIQRGLLHQGWGALGMSLLKAGGSAMSQAEWAPKYKSSATKRGWLKKDLTSGKAHRRYTLLSHMLGIGDGDLILVPNIAENDRKGFVLARAVAIRKDTDGGQCYAWDAASQVASHPLQDRRHLVSINVSSVKAFRYDSSPIAASGENRIRQTA